jgi:cardiolipin synthase
LADQARGRQKGRYLSLQGRSRPCPTNCSFCLTTPPRPLIDAIAGAKKSLNIRMFLFTDPTLIDTVIAAHQRGVKVRVMLNPARRSGESENEEARQKFVDAGIEVRDSNPAFALTHQKSMVVDNETGYVESLNWEPRDLTLTATTPS